MVSTPEKTTVKIALIQSACGDNPAVNLENARAQIEKAADQGAQIICLQELFRSLYFCQTHDRANFDLAEPIPGPTTELMCEIAAVHKVVIIAPLFERRALGLHQNSVVIIDADGSIAGIYRKAHIPDDPQFHEKYYFAPGDSNECVFDTVYGRIGVLICWDQWFPEMARVAALGGATILFYPSAIGWLPEERETEGPAQLDAWMTMHRAHAIANGCYVAALNRTGLEAIDGKLIDFWGNSFVTAPSGAIIARAPSSEPTILMADCPMDKIHAARTAWPFLRDRRPELYRPILNLYCDENL